MIKKISFYQTKQLGRSIIQKQSNFNIFSTQITNSIYSQIQMIMIILYNIQQKFLNFQMEKENDLYEEELDNPKRVYSKISAEVRKKLIRKVQDQKVKVKSAAKQLKIKLSTAKAIMERFKKTGDVHQTKTQKEKRKIKENLKKNEEQNNTVNNEQTNQFEAYIRQMWCFWWSRTLGYPLFL